MSEISAWCERDLITSPHYIALCLASKAFQKELKHLKVPREKWPDFMGSPHADATTHYFVLDNKHSAIVCIRNTKKKSAEAICGLLVHEAVHIWQDICKILGEHSPSSEFEAYSIQALSQVLFEKFAELGGKYATR